VPGEVKRSAVSGQQSVHKSKALAGLSRNHPVDGVNSTPVILLKNHQSAVRGAADPPKNGKFNRFLQGRDGDPNPRVRFIFGANGGLGTARPTGKNRDRARSRVGRDAVLRNPDRAVWADPTHRELSIHCSSGTEHGGLHFVEEINRFEKIAEDLGAASPSTPGFSVESARDSKAVDRFNSQSGQGEVKRSAVSS